MSDSHFKKGIILAAGKGTRLRPLTRAFGKQLLPVYDKPMIYYPIDMLINLGVTDILLIINEHDHPLYEKLIGNGADFGINIQYAFQSVPRGIPDAYIVGKEFIGDDQAILLLGDNIFYPSEPVCDALKTYQGGGLIFGMEVDNPQAFGIAEVDENGKVLSLEEKPKEPKSNLAVVGLYVFDNRAQHIAGTLEPSARGELEVVDVMKPYLETGELSLVNITSEDSIWFDCGVYESLLEASLFVNQRESITGRKIGCLEESAYKNGRISLEQLIHVSQKLPDISYRRYLERLIASEQGK